MTRLDPQQIYKMTYDEEKNANRVFVVNQPKIKQQSKPEHSPQEDLKCLNVENMVIKNSPEQSLKYLRVENMVIESVTVPPSQPVDRIHIKKVPFTPLWARLLIAGQLILIAWTYFK